MRNRPVIQVAIWIVFIFFILYEILPTSPSQTIHSSNGHGGSGIGPVKVSQEILHGDVIAGKLGNETIKAELGRSSWKLLHTMLARFPENPSPEEREALRSYVYLFARLYPCGECAEHFQVLLQSYPPQTSSREAASQWGCVVHNQVNERLGKEIFDCGSIADKYHCGCSGEDDKSTSKSENADLEKTKSKNKKSSEDKEEGLKGSRVGKSRHGEDDGEELMKLEREGLTRGG